MAGLLYRARSCRTYIDFAFYSPNQGQENDCQQRNQSVGAGVVRWGCLGRRPVTVATAVNRQEVARAPPSATEQCLAVGDLLGLGVGVPPQVVFVHAHGHASTPGDSTLFKLRLARHQQIVCVCDQRKSPNAVAVTSSAPAAHGVTSAHRRHADRRLFTGGAVGNGSAPATPASARNT